MIGGWGQRNAFGPFGGHVGVLWGTDVYTVDSTLSLAAVHAGVLKLGENGVVMVTLVGPQAMFQGSVRNGIASNYWGAMSGYKVGRR